MKINVNRTQKIQIFFVVHDDDFNDEKNYQRFKKIKKKSNEFKN